MASQIALNEESNSALNLGGNLGAPLSCVIRLLTQICPLIIVGL